MPFTDQSLPGDVELVARSRAGDGAAFDVLVRRYFRPAYSIALALVGSAPDAEDVVQDSMIRALERLDDCRDPSRFAAWLFRIVRNTAHNARAYHRVRAVEPLPADVAHERAGPDRDAETAELREMLVAGLETLSVAQREVVLLHDLEGWTHRTIGTALGISEVMSRQHLFTARRKLRLHLTAARVPGA